MSDMKYWGVRFHRVPTTGGYAYLLLKRPYDDTSLDVAASIVEAFDQAGKPHPWAERLDAFDLIEFGRDPNASYTPDNESLLGLLQPVASYLQPEAAVYPFRIEKETRTVRKAVRA